MIKMRMKIWAFAFMLIGGLISCQSNASSKPESGSQVEQQNSIAVSLDTETWAKKMAEIPGEIVDVRTDAEYEDGFIEGALHADVLEDSFLKEMEALSSDKDQALFIYCRSGQRSKRAMSFLKDAGYTQIYELNDGFIGWQKAGKPIVK